MCMQRLKQNTYLQTTGYIHTSVGCTIESTYTYVLAYHCIMIIFHNTYVYHDRHIHLIIQIQISPNIEYNTSSGSCAAGSLTREPTIPVQMRLVVPTAAAQGA